MSLQDRYKREPVYTGEGPRWINVEAAAEYIVSTVWFMRKLIRSGEIPYKVNGHSFVLDKLDLDRYMERNKIRS
jgi:hypothetical protein